MEMAGNFDEFDTEGSLPGAHHMPRPRIDKLLDAATRGKLVYVIAGAGYGKTQAVRHYIGKQKDAVVRWVQLGENDNIGSRYWENLTHNISLDNPDLADSLREFGFPETSLRFRQFAAILKTAEHRSKKTFLVLDDFHLIHSEQSLAFAERCAYLHIPGACVIVISRKEPEMNIVPLLAKGQAHIITEEELRFTAEEISDFLKGSEIAFSAKNLPQIIEATKGWALAIRLLSLTLKRLPSSLGFALETMKQNIFKSMEIEAFDGFPESTKKAMVKLSLTSGLPAAISQKLFEGASFLGESPELASFVWFDSLTGEYRVHPLYWEFLQSKHFILSDAEKEETYRQAAKWCMKNNFHLDAMHYFAKLRDFGQMVANFLSFPFKLPPDACEYFLGILEALGLDGEKQGDTDALLLKYLFTPHLLMGIGRYEEAKKIYCEVVEKWENSEFPLSVNLVYAAYGGLTYINVQTCTATHDYAFGEYLRRAIGHLKKSNLPTVKLSGSFAVADVRSFACLVGEGADMAEIALFQEISAQAARYVAESDYSSYYGYDDLLSCELAFFKNRLDDARSFAHEAILKAREKKQYNVEMMAAGYLLRISACEGDALLSKEILKQMEEHLKNPNFWNRQLLYDLFAGFFYLQIGLNRMAPSRMFMEERETPNEVHVPVQELIVCAKNYISLKKYNQALVVLCNSYPREPKERFLLGELTLALLSAAARIKTGDVRGAMKDFEKAYALSCGGEFEMPFIELGRNLHPLAEAALKQENFAAGEKWLKTLARKASIYAKKSAFVANSFKMGKEAESGVQLSDREREVMNDLYHGLSRDEIAANRYLSINTVKKILQSAYIKLDANNNVDAVRIALEKKLVE